MKKFLLLTCFLISLPTLFYRPGKLGMAKNNYSIRVLNTLGQSLFYKEVKYFPSTGVMIDIGNTPNGIYFLEIETDDQRTIKKIVLQ